MMAPCSDQSNVRTDLYDLYRHFLSFSASQLVGVATDQTPHYHDKTRWYRHQVPDTRVGSPGRYQVRGRVLNFHIDTANLYLMPSVCV